MGVMINIHYNDQVMSPSEAQLLTNGLQALIAGVMDKSDVFAFANHDDLNPGNIPVEVFVQVNAAKVNDPADLTSRIASAIVEWKQTNNFNHKINLNLIPVEWHAKLGL